MSYQSIGPGPSLSLYIFCNMVHFYGEEMSAPRPSPKLEDHPLSAVHDCLFHIFAATLHMGGRSFICHLRTCHAVVTGTHLIWTVLCIWLSLCYYSNSPLVFILNGCKTAHSDHGMSSGFWHCLFWGLGTNILEERDAPFSGSLYRCFLALYFRLHLYCSFHNN